MDDLWTMRFRGHTLHFHVFDRIIESDVLLIGRGWAWDPDDLAAIELDPDGFAIVDVDHPNVRWVLIREFAFGIDYERIARILVQRFGDEMAGHAIGHIQADQE